ncbi:hypothetical protein B0J14DRAFT_279768 [Halenospora varia]|nr:hypothetical protein B0J14DRAFT_279768 [Halenospora varia]
MQFSAITLLLALGLSVQATSTIFTCNGSNFGGCCTRFLDNGNGVGCEPFASFFFKSNSSMLTQRTQVYPQLSKQVEERRNTRVLRMMMGRLVVIQFLLWDIVFLFHASRSTRRAVQDLAGYNQVGGEHLHKSEKFTNEKRD